MLHTHKHTHKVLGVIAWCLKCLFLTLYYVCYPLINSQCEWSQWYSRIEIHAKILSVSGSGGTAASYAISKKNPPSCWSVKVFFIFMVIELLEHHFNKEDLYYTLWYINNLQPHYACGKLISVLDISSIEKCSFKTSFLGANYVHVPNFHMLSVWLFMCRQPTV